MRDLAFFGHLLLGVGLVVLPIIILVSLKEKPKWLKAVSAITAAISWLLLLPAGLLYLTFYPATKTVIKAGAWPWAHSVFMETKEHWGLLLPIIATVAVLLVFGKKEEESKKWWILLLAVSFLIAIFGRIVKMGAGA